MNLTNDFVSTLMNNREKIIDKLIQNYSYEYLFRIFKEINYEKDDRISLVPNDKHLYRLLTGLYQGSRYDKSSIDWIPSLELVNGIISLAEHFGITHIEEIYSGLGILSALLINTLNKKNKKIMVTTADTHASLNTCNKLGFVKIAKRSASDYKYYKQINEPYPQMVISTYYPSNENKSLELAYIEEISTLITSSNHKIIIILAPFTLTSFYEPFYHIMIDSNYTFKSYHIKALDKYFFIFDLYNKYYKSSMIAHIFIKNDPALEGTNTANTIIDNGNLDKIFSAAIIPCPFINTYCYYSKWLKMFYEISSPKLVKSIYRTYDLTKPIYYNPKIKEITNHYSILKCYKIPHIPSYIYDIEEFSFWAKRIINESFFTFESRDQYYTFYTYAINADKPEIKQKFNFPGWVQHSKVMYEYIYLDTINTTGDWKTNQYIFRTVISHINKKNRALLTQKNINY